MENSTHILQNRYTGFMPSILLLEDNPEVAAALQGFLQQRGFLVRTASNGLEGLGLFFQQPPSIVLLDIMMPGLHGTEVLCQIRASSQIPVVVLTARTNEREILEGFSLGADDYITKPFRMLEVLARIQAVLRRTQAPVQSLLSRHGVYLETTTQTAQRHGQALDLTPAEFSLLWRLLEHPQRVFRRSELLEKIQHQDTLERTIDTHIKNLRRKLGTDHRIETVFGVGYKYAE